MALSERYNRNNIFQHLDGLLPKNRVNFSFCVLDNTLLRGMLGNVDPKPCEGRVIAKNDDAFIMLSADRKDIRVVDRSLATRDPEVGDTVRATPYARRDFDGYCVTGPKPETRTAADGTAYTMVSTVLGGSGREVKLPVPKAECHELRSLIGLLETERLPDGFRMLTHMLADAGARDFEAIDPKPEDIIRTPPAVAFSVNTKKHCGRVRVFYNRCIDSFGVELLKDGQRTYFDDCIFFDELGQHLHGLIDDGAWNRIDVDLIEPAKKPRKPKRPANTV
jgi:hypothetical protein